MTWLSSSTWGAFEKNWHSILTKFLTGPEECISVTSEKSAVAITLSKGWGKEASSYCVHPNITGIYPDWARDMVQMTECLASMWVRPHDFTRQGMMAHAYKPRTREIEISTKLHSVSKSLKNKENEIYSIQKYLARKGNNRHSNQKESIQLFIGHINIQNPKISLKLLGTNNYCN